MQLKANTLVNLFANAMCFCPRRKFIRLQRLTVRNLLVAIAIKSRCAFIGKLSKIVCLKLYSV